MVNPSNTFSIYQNHPLDSYIDVAMHYVIINDAGTDLTLSDEAHCNATIFSVKDDTNNKRWYVCELHLDDLAIHGTFTIWEGTSAVRRLTKEELLTAVRNFVQAAKDDKDNLGI